MRKLSRQDFEGMKAAEWNMDLLPGNLLKELNAKAAAGKIGTKRGREEPGELAIEVGGGGGGASASASAGKPSGKKAAKKAADAPVRKKTAPLKKNKKLGFKHLKKDVVENVYEKRYTSGRRRR